MVEFLPDQQRLPRSRFKLMLDNDGDSRDFSDLGAVASQLEASIA